MIIIQNTINQIVTVFVKDGVPIDKTHELIKKLKEVSSK